MKRKKRSSSISAVLASVLLLTMLSGCGRSRAAETPAGPVSNTDPVIAAEPAPQSEPEAGTGRQDGERFEDVIILEGMEETVGYEHVRSDTIGFEMDYDYSLFERRGGSDCERFVSRYDDPADPLNYLEVSCSPADAEAVSAAIGRALSEEYDVITESCELARAGSCIRIDASNAKNNGGTPDLLQAVYIVPAADGCRVATAHYSFESAEGFGRRFRYLMDTFTLLSGHAESVPEGTWQTASMAYEADGTVYPEYHVQFTPSEILYGHMKDGAFAADHADRILFVEKAAEGGIRIRAEASNGALYTLQTSESDETVLEYFETWREEDFPQAYRGGASLSRCG